jgi:rare lipoprotein A
VRLHHRLALAGVGALAVLPATAEAQDPNTETEISITSHKLDVVAGSRGRFELGETVSTPGSSKARVRTVGATSFATPGGTPAAGDTHMLGRLDVYRRSFASYYQPGDAGGGALACGGRLSWGTQGVAHKTLPCGTKVTFKLGNREVRVPVIDRGPYVGGREWDLTVATKRKLGFGSTGTVLSTK